LHIRNEPDEHSVVEHTCLKVSRSSARMACADTNANT